MSKKFIYVVLFLGLIYGLFLFAFNQSTNKKIDNYLSKYTQIKQKQYEVVSNSFRKIAINSFYGILNKPNIIEILNEIELNSADYNTTRKSLYKTLKADYRTLKMLGVTNLNFYLPNNTTFIKMKNFNDFSKDIKTDKKSIGQVNKTQLPFEGFESAGYNTAFRFIYPMFNSVNNKYLGCVELSFDIDEIKNVFEKSFETSVNLILNQKYLDNSIHKQKYVMSKENSKYLQKKDIQNIHYNTITQLTREEYKRIEKRSDLIIENEKAASLYIRIDNNSKIITYIPLKNEVTGETNGYIVSYDNDYNIRSIKSEFFIVLTISIIVFILLIYIINRELHTSEVLEKKVFDKTAEIRQLYTHEHYLKNLLQTISNINESLISSYSIESIIDGSLQKLSQHEAYKASTYGFIDNNRIFTRYKKGDIYNLITDDHVSLSLDNKNHILSSAIEAVITNKTALNNNIDFKQFVEKSNRESDYIIQSAISILLKNEKNENFGVLTLFSENSEFDQEEINLLEGLAIDISMALNATKQKNIIEKLHTKQISNYEETVLAFVAMIEQRDAYTAGHTVRVAKYCRLIAQEFNLDNMEISKLEKAAILHDIGKIATPDTILLKPGKLSNLEYNLIKNHVEAGYRMLNKVEMYKELAEIIIYHHEHYDGTGYPYGLKGDQIPRLGHILIIADAFDAMTTNRIYKSRLTSQEAVEEILKNAGTQFDPEVANIAAKVLIDLDIEHTTQLPQNVLEEQRFAYFFSDGLTGLYNEAYLSLVMDSNENFTSLIKVELKGMTAYNHKYGWEKGNILLKEIAEFFKELYPNSLVFRYHGDNYFALSKNHQTVNRSQIEKYFMRYDIDKTIKHYDLNEYDDFYDILDDEVI